VYRSAHYPSHFPGSKAEQPKEGTVTASGGPPEVRFVDVGCGFGGLLVKLAPLYPDTLMLGMELRDKVCSLLSTY
jgi:tRNA (guanine-N7-)-methyltransferase